MKTLDKYLHDITNLRNQCKMLLKTDYVSISTQVDKELTIIPKTEPPLSNTTIIDLRQLQDLARILEEAKQEIQADLDEYPNTITTKRILAF